MRDGVVLVWDLTNGRESPRFTEHAGRLLIVRFSHDRAWLASGGMDQGNRIVLYDVRRQRVAKHFEGHTRFIVGLTFTLDDKSVVSCSWDGTVRFWYLAGKILSSRGASRRLSEIRQRCSAPALKSSWVGISAAA